MHAMLLPVGADLYALPVDRIRKVLTAPPVIPLVTGPAVVTGLFNLRGEIVPLFDTAALLGIGRIDSVAYAVVLSGARDTAALAVTAAPEPTVLGSAVATAELVGCVETYEVDGRAVVLMDPEELFAPDRIGGESLAVLTAVTGA